MRKVHACMKRDWFTCHDCLNLTFKGFEPYCRRNERAINWNLRGFGCGEYATADEIRDPIWLRISGHGHTSLRRIMR